MIRRFDLSHYKCEGQESIKEDGVECSFDPSIKVLCNPDDRWYRCLDVVSDKVDQQFFLVTHADLTLIHTTYIKHLACSTDLEACTSSSILFAN